MASVGREEEPPKDYSRRDFIKAATLAAGAIGTLAASGSARSQDEEVAGGLSARLSLRAAGYKLKRLEALFDGRVRIEGCDARFEQMGIGDMNTNVFSGPQTLDVTEIGLHPFMLAYANDNFRAYTLLPIYPLRLFRHKSSFKR